MDYDTGCPSIRRTSFFSRSLWSIFAWNPPLQIFDLSFVVKRFLKLRGTIWYVPRGGNCRRQIATSYSIQAVSPVKYASFYIPRLPERSLILRTVVYIVQYVEPYICNASLVFQRQSQTEYKRLTLKNPKPKLHHQPLPH